MDGDGLDDLLLGAVGYDGAGSGAGGAFVFLGGLTGSVASTAADGTYNAGGAVYVLFGETW